MHKLSVLVTAVVGNLVQNFDYPVLLKRTEGHDLPVQQYWCDNEPLATDEPFVDPGLIPVFNKPDAMTKTPQQTMNPDPDLSGPSAKSDDPNGPKDNTVIYATGGAAAGIAAVAAGVFFFKKRAKPASAEQTAEFAENTNMNPAYVPNSSSVENPLYQGNHLDEWTEPEK